MSIFASLLLAALPFTGTYFAPTSPLDTWRMRDGEGDIHEFISERGKLTDDEGWIAERKGETIIVRAQATSEMPPITYYFKDGRLEAVESGKMRAEVPTNQPTVYAEEPLPPLWDFLNTEVSEEQRRELLDIWKAPGRLRLWFNSPNQAGTFLAFLIVSFAIGALKYRKLVFRLGFSALAVVAMGLLVWTDSRGAILSTIFALGVVGFVFLHSSGYFARHRRQTLIFMAAVVLFAVLAVVGIAARRGEKAVRQSDVYRTQIWQTAPRMLVDAPWGWGACKDAGLAYSRWYAPTDEGRFWLNLLNDHLTILVAKGRLVGGVYLFLWIAGITFLFGFALRGGSSIPVAIWTVLGISSCFNVIMFARTMLWLPIASLGFLGFDRRWMKWKCFKLPLLIGIVGTLFALGAIAWVGSRITAQPSITKQGESICVNGQDPSIWVLADKHALGHIAAELEVKYYYREHPKARAIGWVERVEDLPSRGIQRLVLTGERIADYLARPMDAKAGAETPKELIFLSPYIAPSEIPPEILAKSRVRYIIGEFAARYYPELVTPPAWCTIVPGAEIYIPGWMRWVFSQK